MEGSIIKQEQPHEDQHYEKSASCGCGCIRLFGFKPFQNDENNNEGEKRHVFRETTKLCVSKMKEFSEIVSGPKWKNFIRQVGGYCKGNKKYNKTRFQYDPRSYALNFDSGLGREEDPENGPLLR